MNFDLISMRFQWEIFPLLTLLAVADRETGRQSWLSGNLEGGKFFNRPLLGDGMINFQTKTIVDTNVERKFSQEKHLPVCWEVLEEGEEVPHDDEDWPGPGLNQLPHLHHELVLGLQLWKKTCESQISIDWSEHPRLQLKLHQWSQAHCAS